MYRELRTMVFLLSSFFTASYLGCRRGGLWWVLCDVMWELCMIWEDVFGIV